MKLNKEDRINKISKKEYVKDENELISVIEQMEADDLLIKTGDSVVLMNDWYILYVLFTIQFYILFYSFYYFSRYTSLIFWGLFVNNNSKFIIFYHFLFIYFYIYSKIN